MHANTLDGSGSPKKRTFTRGVSEDESLRSIIQETESSSRRPTRSEGRTGTLKKRTDSQQSDQDLFTGLPEMLDLQASYNEAMEELRGLEVEREALLFQVDVLQDTLEGVEELLAETQREAGQASLELEQERQAKKKLEDLVCSLLQEVERLKEERNGKAPDAENTSSVTRWGQTTHDASAVLNKERGSSWEPPSPETSHGGWGAAEKGGPTERPKDAGDVPTKVQRAVSSPVSHLPSLALSDLPPVDGVLRRQSFESYARDGRDPSPDSRDSDSVSAYDDASAETPDFTGDGELPDDAENRNKMLGSSRLADCNKDGEPRSPESCILS